MPRFHPPGPLPKLGPNARWNCGRNFETGDIYVETQWYGLMKGDKVPNNIETERKILVAIQKLFAEPSKWTKGALCRLGGGKAWTKVEHPNVTCWCIVGALDLVKHKNYALLGAHADRLYNRMNGIARRVGFACLEDFNDHPQVTHAHMLKFLSKVSTSMENENG